MDSIWSGLSASQLDARDYSLIVFPEGVTKLEIEETSQRRPSAVVVGAFNDGRDGRMRGVIWHGGCEVVAYDKVGGDGRTPGGPQPVDAPVYMTDTVAIAVLVCCDIQKEIFGAVVAKLATADVPFKAICISADMWDASWFSTPGPVGYASWGDVHVVLSNGPGLEGGVRPPSFITNARREKVRIQVGFGEIWWPLDEGGCGVGQALARSARAAFASAHGPDRAGE